MAWLVGVLVLVAEAQDLGLRTIQPERKLALVIGNGNYPEHTLTNPPNDARAVARLLREDLGFAPENVELRMDLGRWEDMAGVVKDFGARVRSTDLAFFYYSGHCGSVAGENYLLPTKYEAVEEHMLEFSAVSLERVRKALSIAQLRVIVLDVCRTELPLVKGRGGPEGLVNTQLGDAQGEFIAYAGSANQGAADPMDGIGLYAKHLVTELKQPGVEFRAAFQRVSNAVYVETGGQQRPMTADQLLGAEFYFVPTERHPPPLVPSVATGPAGVGSSKPAEQPWERDWKALEGIEDPAQARTVRQYIAKYRKEPAADLWVTKAEVLLDGLLRVSAGTGPPDGSRPPEPDVLGKVWRNGLGMEFAWIPAGSFVMGSSVGEEGRDTDEQHHRVTISRGFWMGKHEVTQEQWEAVMGENPSHFSHCGRRCPVESVSWVDVQEYIRMLNARESEQGNRYRLPTEAEWEYAARAGTAGATPGGELWIDGRNIAPVLAGQAWYRGNSGVRYANGYDCRTWEERQNGPKKCGPHPVGMKRANAWGLHDMLGNVYEWVGDWYGKYPPSAVTDPAGPSMGTERVVRGGAWIFDPKHVRSASRDSYNPEHGLVIFGFRLVRIY